MTEHINPPHFDPRTRSHHADPDSSREAAAKMASTGAAARQQQQARAAVYTYPGFTSKELAKRTGLDRHMLARRLPEIEDIHQHPAKGGVTWHPGKTCGRCPVKKAGLAELFGEEPRGLPD